MIEKLMSFAVLVLVLIVALLAIPRPSCAAPFYDNFFQNPSKPIMSAGSFSSFKGDKSPKYGTALALIYHNDPAPESFVSSLYAQHALTVGGGWGGGVGFGGIGVVVNLLPATKTGLRNGLDLITKPEQMTNLKDLLAPPKAGTIDLTIAVGPQFTFNIFEDGAFLGPQKWKGDPRIFTGAQLLFGGPK